MFVYIVVDETKAILGVYSNASVAYHSIMSSPKFADIRFREKGDPDTMDKWWEKDGTEPFVICSFVAKAATRIGSKRVPVYTTINRQYFIKRMCMT
jgi:hypothetical protein